MPPEAADAARAAAEALCRTAAASRWEGPDIYDALAARWPRPLVAGKRRRQAVLQLHARAPIDLRPLSRRTYPRIAKTLALFAMADGRLARSGDPEARGRAELALDLLGADRAAGVAAWGYPWDMQTRWGHYRKGDPNVVVTAFAIEALVRGASLLDAPAHAQRAADAARWVQDELFVEDLGIYAYHAGSRTVVHNASLLGARAAWRAADRDPRVRPAVERAVERTLAGQRPDGAFPYGEGDALGWVDSFHTAYVLECLAELAGVDPAVPDALDRGTGYFVDRFFDATGRALLRPSAPYPEDAHSLGSGLTALALLHGQGLVPLELVERVTARACSAMVRGGHAVHRRYRWGRTRVTYVRWADAHVALGLANAAAALSGDGSPRDARPPAPSG